MKFQLLFYFLIAVCCACESEPISWESAETSKSLRLDIEGLPNEIYGSTSYQRKIFLYSSKQDLLNDENPIDRIEYSHDIFESPFAYFYNVTSDEVYVRVYSSYIFDEWFYRCETAIRMSNYSGETVFVLDDSNRIEEL